jgi:predicted Fe-Mo cluster-binding NifX family protein
MKLAIPLARGIVAPRLEQGEQFDFVEVDCVERRILSAGRADPISLDPPDLARWLASERIDLLLLGELTASQRHVFEGSGIKVVEGAPPGAPHDVVKGYLRDEICDEVAVEATD